MTQSLDKLLLHIYNHPEIERYIYKVVPNRYYDDMKHHLILECHKIKEEKLNKMYNDSTLKFFIFKIIKNQMDPNCGNCFYKKIIKPSQFEEVDKIVIRDNDNKIVDDRLDMIEDCLRGLKPWKVILFKMYYEDGLNFREISQKTGMNIKTVQSWIYECRDSIKESIERKKNKNDYEDFND